MRIVIVTGMSGAGKRTAMKILEDAGYFCVDNIPVIMFKKFTDLLFNSMGNVDKLAFGIDVRSGNVDYLCEILDEKNSRNKCCEILFLDSSDDVLIRRYKETRRNHPLVNEDRVDEGIDKERKMVSFIKERADYIINTDNMLTKDLKIEIDKIFVDNKEYKNIYINILSFGFKYGIPKDSDLVFDVRFLPNPFYVDELKRKTGNDKEVRDYVMENGLASEFIDKLEDMLSFLIPKYEAEGKHQLVISIGCTGGKHRSVTVANKIYEKIMFNGEYGVKIVHRDIGKE